MESSNIDMRVAIYVLELIGGKYYIGASRNVKNRLATHFNCNGADWTKKYPPVKVIEVREGDIYDETVVTCAYMRKYGIDNVRGGAFAFENLFYQSFVEDFKEKSDVEVREYLVDLYTPTLAIKFLTDLNKPSANNKALSQPDRSIVESLDFMLHKCMCCPYIYVPLNSDHQDLNKELKDDCNFTCTFRCVIV